MKALNELFSLEYFGTNFLGGWLLSERSKITLQNLNLNLNLKQSGLVRRFI